MQNKRFFYNEKNLSVSQVARVQLLVLEGVKCCNGSDAAAIARLNAGLLDITTLYEKVFFFVYLFFKR